MNKTITDVTAASEFAEDYLHTFPNDPRTEHQLGAVHLYTQGWSDSSESLYAKLNRDLASEDDRYPEDELTDDQIEAIELGDPRMLEDPRMDREDY